KHVTVSGNAYVIASASGSGNMSRIMEIAQRHGGVTSVTEDKPNLENVFLTLTGKKLRDDGEV
ncbi:MAG: export ABC transporter ATP-binding protein, partial [Oscillospiraceae bacterium]|nr:export ABC transporter ATP-binding protein [Oscillospiraceae bacterium]